MQEMITACSVMMRRQFPDKVSAASKEGASGSTTANQGTDQKSAFQNSTKKHNNFNWWDINKILLI